MPTPTLSTSLQPIGDQGAQVLVEYEVKRCTVDRFPYDLYAKAAYIGGEKVDVDCFAVEVVDAWQEAILQELRRDVALAIEDDDGGWRGPVPSHARVWA